MSKPSLTGRFDRYLIPLSGLILFLIATQVAFANLPASKLFAGHDSGFYTLFPDQLIRTSAGTWEVKTALGFVNFQALVTLPFAILVILINALHFTGATVGRIFYEVQILLCEFGTFWIAWLILQRFYAESSRLIRAIAALIAALVATFNIFTAVLLMYPPSNFQMGIFVWPVVIAFELHFLWKRPRISTAILFGMVLTLATLGNPAHTMLGFALVAAIYIIDAIANGDWRLPSVAAVAVTFFATSIFFWLPAFASVFMYHGNVSAPEGANAAALTSSAELIKLRTTIAALLRFDGLLWWPKTRNADLYNGALMVLATYVPAALAIVALLTRRWIARAFWVLLLLGVELGKSAHPPFQLNLVAVMTTVPLFAAFRQTYDKFALYIMLALPVLAAIGLVVLLSQRKLLRAAIVAIVLIAVSTWPFVGGRAVDPYFLTSIPSDYSRVDQIMGNDAQARVLSLPGGSNEIYVTDWFKGGNFENLVYRTHAVNSAIFKQRGISAAPLYDDFDLVQAQELPQLIGLLGIYDIKYVLLHKDNLTSYRMAFDFERYHVLGPLLARAAQRYLDADPRLTKVYEGPSLVLYDAKESATLGHAFGSYQAGTALGYQNTLFGLVDAGLMSARNRPALLFVGNQVVPAGGEQTLTTLVNRSSYVVRMPLIPETPALYREQTALSPGTAQALSQQYSQLAKPAYLVFVQPHGDWLKGSVSPSDNISGAFFLDRPQRSNVSMTIRARRAPQEALRDFIGRDGGRPWALSAFADEPPASAVITENDLVDPEETPPPNSREPFVDPSMAELGSIRAPATVTIDRASGTYVVRLQHGGEIQELAVASRPIHPIALLNDPRLVFDYEFSDPKLQAAWLRFEFFDPRGNRVYLDKQLDESGHLENFDIRDNLQAGLDRRFNREAALHQYDPLWFSQQRIYNPPQADAFRLTSLRLILGKPPFTDFSSQPTDVAFRFRGLQIAVHNPDPPAYIAAGYRADFAGSQIRTRARGVSEMTILRRNGAVLINAAAISGRTDAAVSATLHLPAVDLERYPYLRLRYWQPVSTEELILKLGFIVQGRVEEVPAGLDVPQNGPPEAPPPSAWIKPTRFVGMSPPISLDAKPIPFAAGDWQELTCDLRRVAAYRVDAVHPHLAYITLQFREKNPPPNVTDPSLGNLSNLVFALGDVALVGASSGFSALGPPRKPVLNIDGKPQRQEGAATVARMGDQLQLRFAHILLARGAHRIETHVLPPWEVSTVAIAPNVPAPGKAAPQLSIRHIDDELFAVHVTRQRAFWLSFAETYHTGWRLIESAPPKNRLFWALSFRWLGKPAGDHVVGNAFNNTWYVQGTHPGDYVIDFAPQDFAVFGKALTLLAVLLAATLSVYWWRR
ncbi:MAG: hypothetical protein JO135_05200 [Candidatus Eremiobacteraeota bacterium]|nr:hypothetical protein [Candidatus Eremiobacteraeota bacterium]